MVSKNVYTAFSDNLIIFIRSRFPPINFYLIMWNFILRTMVSLFFMAIPISVIPKECKYACQRGKDERGLDKCDFSQPKKRTYRLFSVVNGYWPKISIRHEAKFSII